MNFRITSMLVGGMLGAAATLYWYSRKPSTVAVVAHTMSDMYSAAMGKAATRMMNNATEDKQEHKEAAKEQTAGHHDKSDIGSVIEEISAMNH